MVVHTYVLVNLTFTPKQLPLSQHSRKKKHRKPVIIINKTPRDKLQMLEYKSARENRNNNDDNNNSSHNGNNISSSRSKNKCCDTKNTKNPRANTTMTTTTAAAPAAAWKCGILNKLSFICGRPTLWQPTFKGEIMRGGGDGYIL